MSAKNITTEKMDSSGFQTGGVSEGPGAAKKTPKGAIMNDLENDETGRARIKAGPEAGKESKNNKFYKG